MNAVYSKRVFGSYSDNPKPVPSINSGQALSLAEGSAIQKRPRGPKRVGILAIAFTFAFSGAVVEAQQPAGIPRIGILIASSASVYSARVEAFRQRLRELGYVEGKNIRH